MPNDHLPNYADVAAAAQVLTGQVHRTPVLRSRRLDARAGAQIHLKAEHLQRVGAFKFRGALTALSAFTEEQRRRGVVAFSSGNHAQAIALAARELGMPAVIIMPHDAPAQKVAATEGYGAEVVRYDRYAQAREPIAAQLAAARGMTLVPPFDHPQIIAGQGTAVRELIEDAGDLDVIVTPLGGGGLLSGSILATRALLPTARIYGVEPQAGDDGVQSLRAGRIVTIETPHTLADGAQTTQLGELTFPIIAEGVTDLLTATDEELVAAMAVLATDLKQVVEPTGALALAAVLSGAVPDIAGRKVGVLLSGGNVDLARFAQLVGAH